MVEGASSGHKTQRTGKGGDAPPTDMVTGAFGFTGRYIARRLIAQGRRVRTLTGHPGRPDPFGGEVTACPFNFDKPEELRESLRGIATLYNTYWVRFPHGERTFEQAVEHTRILLRGAAEAGVRRIVHVSITNAAEASTIPYFHWKGVLERAVRESGLSWAILRPALIFGREDIIINNIAWLLRRFPLFAVFGTGEYQVQPIYVEDLAELAVDAGGREDDMEIDAVGPELFTFTDLVRLIAEKIGSRARIVHLPPTLALKLSGMVGAIVQDVLLTQDELAGLMSDLLVSGRPPTGRTRLSAWLESHAEQVGREYASELARHYQ